MTKIIPIDPVQNVYANHPSFMLVAKHEVPFEGRSVHKLTYRNSRNIIWKVMHVAIAAFLTLVSLGIAVCFLNGIIWSKALAQFKDRTVHQNISASQHISTLSATTLTNAAMPPIIHSPSIAPPSIIIQTNPSPPPVCPTQNIAPPVSLLIQVQQRIGEILIENPEFKNAVKYWDRNGVPVDEQSRRLELLRKFAFGTDKWVKYFGEIVGDVPPLPEDIYQIYHKDDPYRISPGEKIKDSHVLVLVPKSVRIGGKQIDISLESLNEIVKSPKNGGKRTAIRILKAEGHEKTGVLNNRWVLMRKNCIPNSRNKTYEEQMSLIGTKAAHYMPAAYCMPNVLEATACTLMHFVDSGRKLFDVDDPEGLTYILCQEKTKNGDHLTVGGFNSKGFVVNNISYVAHFHAATAMIVF